MIHLASYSNSHGTVCRHAFKIISAFGPDLLAVLKTITRRREDDTPLIDIQSKTPKTADDIKTVWVFTEMTVQPMPKTLDTLVSHTTWNSKFEISLTNNAISVISNFLSRMYFAPLAID